MLSAFCFLTAVPGRVLLSYGKFVQPGRPANLIPILCNIRNGWLISFILGEMAQIEQTKRGADIAEPMP